MKTIGFIIITIIAVVALVMVWDTVLPQPEANQASVRSAIAPDWCLSKTIPPDAGEFVIQEQEGGTYNYQLYATSHGIEVWVPCK